MSRVSWRSIEQVRRHAGVHGEPGRVDAQREQRPHGLLDVMADEGAGEDRVQLLHHRGGTEQLAGHHDREAGLLTLGRHEGEPDQVAATGQAVPPRRGGDGAGSQFGQARGDLRRRRGQGDVAQLQGRHRRKGLGLDRGGGRSRGSPRLGTGTARHRLTERAGVEQFLQTVPDGPHLEMLERGLRRGAVPAAQLQVGHVHAQGHVAHQRDDAGVRPRQLLVGSQVLPQLRRQRTEVGENPVEVAVVRQELGRRLLAHPGHAGQVVRGIAAQRGQQHVLGGRHPAALEDAGLVVEGVVADAPLVVEHAHVRVLHELEAVAVAGDDDHLALAYGRLGGQGGDHVVRLEPGRLDHRDGERGHHLADHVELRRQQPRRLGPAGLVVRQHLVAERVARGVEGHREGRRALLPDEVHQHGREAVHRIGDDARRGGQRVGEGEVGPEGQ
jgi:hypothetical protein